MEQRRLRVRERMFGPACYGGGYGWHHHHYWGAYPPPPPWWGERPTPEEEQAETLGLTAHKVASRVSGIEQRRIDDLRITELRLDLRDPTLDEALALLRGVVFRVLRKVAMGPRLGDRVNDSRPIDRLQSVKLGAEALGASYG